MRRIFGVSLALASAIGCASAGSSTSNTPAPTETSTRIAMTGATGMQASAGNADVKLTSTPSVGVATFDAPVDRVWREMGAIYEALGIETNTLDPTRHLIGNPQMKVRRRLGTVPLTKYIDCGSTQGTPSAESYEILLNIHSHVVADGATGSKVTTTFQSMGRPVSMSGEYRTCTSTGALEKRIEELLRTRLSM